MKAVLAVIGGGAALLVGALGSAPAQPLTLAQLVPGAVVTQRFGCTVFQMEPIDESCPQRHFHSGIDLAAPTGTPVHAAAAGVAKVVDGPGYGLHVIVTHDRETLTLYGHLSAALVKTGDSVSRGELIGLVGSTGMSTGPHLHFEVRWQGSPVDPVAWLASTP
jgi:murein DD-endopeptidase MepM/ murein hydrolase activator NlpD